MAPPLSAADHPLRVCVACMRVNIPPHTPSTYSEGDGTAPRPPELGAARPTDPHEMVRSWPAAPWLRSDPRPPCPLGSRVAQPAAPLVARGLCACGSCCFRGRPCRPCRMPRSARTGPGTLEQLSRSGHPRPRPSAPPPGAVATVRTRTRKARAPRLRLSARSVVAGPAVSLSDVPGRHGSGGGGCSRDRERGPPGERSPGTPPSPSPRWPVSAAAPVAGPARLCSVRATLPPPPAETTP